MLWGDARKGREVFAQKGCGTCHAICGTGASVGPDLGKTSAKNLTMTRMARALWNQAPAMKQMAAERGEFRGTEMRDLIAFLYAVKGLDEPGDPRRGARLFVEKGCVADPVGGAHVVPRLGHGDQGPRVRAPVAEVRG